MLGLLQTRCVLVVVLVFIVVVFFMWEADSFHV